jgi:hypothetical protein
MFLSLPFFLIIFFFFWAQKNTTRGGNTKEHILQVYSHENKLFGKIRCIINKWHTIKSESDPTDRGRIITLYVCIQIFTSGAPSFVPPK